MIGRTLGVSVTPRLILSATGAQGNAGLIECITFMTHIIWTGKGYLVFVVVFGCSLIANLIFNAEVGPGYYDNHKWPVAVSFLVSAPIAGGLAIIFGGVQLGLS
jgi:hypothetical protein